MKITQHHFKTILVTCIIVIVLMYIIYKLTYQNHERFTNNTQNEYLKFNETYIPDKNMKLDLLYVNYNGDEVSHDKWENKTLDQCMDTCNKLDNCIGFSRPIVNDQDYSTCYPRTNLDQCYTNRKGDFEQRQHSLGYNSFVKSNVNNVLTKCIGDNKLTLNTTIYIKSYAFPNTYLGISTDGNLELINIKNQPQLIRNCSWTLLSGLDGSGTISLKNNINYKYLYRDLHDKIIINDLNQNSKTIDKQRASFHILDGLSNHVIFQCVPLDLETNEKYISVYNKNNKYLNIVSSHELESNTNKKTLKNMKLLTFELLDTIITSSIIDKHVVSEIPEKTYFATPNQKMAESMKNINNDKFINTPTKPLDKSNDDFTYYNLFSGTNTDKNIQNYLQDNYAKENNMIDDNFLVKFNSTQKSNNLNNVINNSKNYYDELIKTNDKLEKMINQKNNDIYSKSDLLVNKLNKMRIQEDASDYYFLKNLSNK